LIPLKIFGRYIPTACLFGGISFGCLCIAGDFLGYAGLGTTTFIAASTIYQYYEEIAREKSISKILLILF
jgi:preprotein translocase subunit SecY